MYPGIKASKVYDQVYLQEKKCCYLYYVHLCYSVQRDENISCPKWYNCLSISAELYQVPVIGVTVPIMWFYLLMNVITQYPLHSSAMCYFATEIFFLLTVQWHAFHFCSDLFCSKETGPSSELLSCREREAKRWWWCGGSVSHKTLGRKTFGWRDRSQWVTKN